MLQATLKRNPAILLLIFVYLWVLPTCLSYQNAWVEPEQFKIKSYIVKTGADLKLHDLKNGLFWQVFEYKPRSTRPLSSYFEIVDTKFRCWLWHYMMPHPSLSLTWVFSLFLAPIFLYRLIRNLGANQNTSLTMVAFYLVTPGVLSYEVMLFRPAKPMTNFFLIFCLYQASQLKKEFLDENKPIPALKFLVFWAITACSIYWDETMSLIFPAVLFIFPALFKKKSLLFSWLLLPMITLIAYLAAIPYLCTLAGHDWPHLLKYDIVQSIFGPATIHNFIKFLGTNAKNLVLETLGIFSFSNTAPKLIPMSVILAVFSWATLLVYVLKTKKWFDPLLIFLIFLLFVFNGILSLTMLSWGPYYYGSFWSVFFIIFLSTYIEKSNIPKIILLTCFFFITIATTNCFLGINTIYKKYHWYPYSPETIEDYFRGTRPFFDKRDTPVFSGSDIHSAIYQYWTKVKNGANMDTFSLPRELGWLPIELYGTKSYYRYIPGGLFKNAFQHDFPDGAEIFDWLVQQNYMVKYHPENYFIKEDINTTIANGLKEKYPDRWEKILAVLKKAQSKRPFYYTYSSSDSISKLAATYNNNGNIYCKQGDFTRAISAYDKAIALKNDYEDAYFNLAFIFYKQGNLEQAIFDYNRSIEINPKDTEAYYNRAVVYYKLKEYDKAWADVRKIKESGVAVDPKLIDALLQIPAIGLSHDKK